MGLYATLGLTVLAYDKRGNGASTDQYPGELATESNLYTYAGDAAAVAHFFASWPGIDPKRIGFHGGSQGGWIAPLAMRGYPAAAFAVHVSAPAITTGQQQTYASFSGGSSRLPTLSQAEQDTQLLADHSGYDPVPVLAATGQPILWLNGAVDRQVSTVLTAANVNGLHHPGFEVQVLPGVDHGMFENPSGLFQDEPKATKLAVGLAEKIATWLSRVIGTAPVPL